MSKTAKVPRAVVLGCAGSALSDAERRFFAEADPLGFILFARNVNAPDQVRALIGQLRDSVARDDALILIDQEGGRVARLGPPHWPELPAPRRAGDLAARDFDSGVEAACLLGRAIAEELAQLGITVACAPVLDVPVAGAHQVIGDRAFSDRPELVAALGRAFAESMIERGVLPVIKHIPGHGRALVDSHEALPRVNAAGDVLRATDFAPFRALSDMPMAMTAHVIYEAFDPDAPATTSKAVVNAVIRDNIGFDGLLFSDDLSMSALHGAIDARATGALEAGCDVALHCNGDMAEMEKVAAAVGLLSEQAQSRLNRAMAQKRDGEPTELAQLTARLTELVAGAPN